MNMVIISIYNINELNFYSGIMFPTTHPPLPPIQPKTTTPSQRPGHCSLQDENTLPSMQSWPQSLYISSF